MEEIITIIIRIIIITFIIWIEISIKELKAKTKEIEKVYDKKIKHLWDKIDEQKAKIKELEEKINLPE